MQYAIYQGFDDFFAPFRTSALMGLSLGLILYLITPIDLLTALLSSMPGGAASISAIAGDLGADLRVVASIHLIRLMFLSLLMPPLFYLIKRYRLERMRE